MIKKLTTTLILSISLVAGLFSQLGISLGYVKVDAPNFSQLLADREGLSSFDDFNQGTLQFSLDYWFRLKKQRIEFFPEISYHAMKADYEGVSGVDLGSAGSFDSKVFQLNFNTQIYPFDFKGDCNCPTFSKDGEVLKKGFFLRIAPGVSAFKNQEEHSTITIAGSETTSRNKTFIGANLRAGIGLDIGISDFITITPIAQYTYTLPTEPWNYFINPADADVGASEHTQLYVGLRLGLRFDELNKYGYR